MFNHSTESPVHLSHIIIWNQAFIWPELDKDTNIVQSIKLNDGPWENHSLDPVYSVKGEIPLTSTGAPKAQRRYPQKVGLEGTKRKLRIMVSGLELTVISKTSKKSLSPDHSNLCNLATILENCCHYANCYYFTFSTLILFRCQHPI